MTEQAHDIQYHDNSPLNEFEIIEHVWIEMSDGVRLSAKLWLPKDAVDNPVPSILEFIPYRKRDATAFRDHGNHAWFAARGYACVRPDMRGHGDSEGIMQDEYLPREQQDAVEIIDWISRQDWCSGNVGMMGISWGGIASMQAATHQPPALKAIIPVGATVDRYYADGAYLVGAYPGQGLGWGGVMFGYCIRPPDPAVVGDQWRDMWMERLEQTPMFAEKWLTHQLRDETWTQGSVCENYDQIQVPVLGVSGWNDCWPNTMIRLLENITAPCRAVSGAYAHVYPNNGGPGPMFGFLQLALDWWDQWLKGIDNGVMDQPAFLAFIQDSHTPNPNPDERPGRWISESEWPSQDIRVRQFGMTEGKLTDKLMDNAGSAIICSKLSLGLATGEYMPIAGIAELPHDQRSDDAYSVCFDTPPLESSLEMLGTPMAHLTVSSDCAQGLIAARICDVAPDGASTLISYGILNLKLRNGQEMLAPVTPGENMDVSIRLNDTGWRIAAGHRLRLALSSQLWPMAWPVGEEAVLKLDLTSCNLEIPVRTCGVEEIDNPFEAAEVADPPLHQVLRPSSGHRHITEDIGTGRIVLDVADDRGDIHLYSIDLDYGATNSQRYSITDNDPLSAKVEYRAGFTFRRGDWDVRTESNLTVTCDETQFFLVGSIAAYEGKTNVYTRDWDIKVPRTIY